MLRMTSNFTFREMVEGRIQRIFDEWEDWPDRPVPPKPYMPPTLVFPGERKYVMDCGLFRGVQIGLLVEKGYKRAYVKARIKELRSKYNVVEFGDYARVEPLKKEM